MKQNAVKFYAVSLLLIGLTGCGGGGSKGGGTTTTTPVTTSSTVAVSGVVQGPMVKGTININTLSQTLGAASAIPSISVVSPGTFSATLPTNSIAALAAIGTYYDEVAGATSTANITLNSYASSSDTALNINMLTTLAYQRIQALVSTGMTFSAARQQAEQEVLAAFYIRDQNTYNFGSLDLTKGRDEDHILAAITSVLENNGNSNISGTVSNLISNFQTEIANNNGSVVSTATINALKNNAIGVVPASIATNLSGKPVSTPYTAQNISEWLDHDGDQVVGKFKYPVAQAQVGSPYTFPIYTVGASDNGATYSFATSSNNNPNAISPNVNSTCKFTAAGNVTPSVSAGNPIVVTCKPAAHESSSTYLKSIIGTNSPIYVARYDFNPFLTVGSLANARTNPTATVLPSSAGSLNGYVLVAGGTVAGAATATAELYNPATQTFATIKSMNVARVGHTATLLNNGSVLVIGGDASGKAGTAELYNPTTGIWTKTALPPNSGHIYHTATLLQSGQVLVVGGILTVADNTGAKSVEVYDPTAGTWTLLNPMTNTPSRFYHTATLLNTGRVLISGGFDGTAAVSDSEILAPTATPTTNCISPTSCWSTTSNSITAGAGLKYASYFHSATLIQDGSVDGAVLIAGGLGATSAPQRSELLNASTNTWSDGNPLNTARVGHVAQLLSDGNVLIAGGSTSNSNSTLSSAELYASGSAGSYPNNFSSNSFNPSGNLTYSRTQFSSVLLNNGDVLLVGGQGVNPAETFR